MNCETLINSTGLVLDILGAVLLWKFGLPESISREGSVFLLAEKPNEVEIAKAKNFDRWANTGLGLLVLGFALQLVSNFM